MKPEAVSKWLLFIDVATRLSCKMFATEEFEVSEDACPRACFTI